MMGGVEGCASASIEVASAPPAVRREHSMSRQTGRYDIAVISIKGAGMFRLLNIPYTQVLCIGIALHMGACSTQEDSEQADVALANEPTAQIDEQLVRRPSADPADAVQLTLVTTHHVMLGGEAFLPGRPADYTNSFGSGGACISSGSNAMAAPVQLPQGAVITGFQGFFNDISPTTDLIVSLQAYYPAGGYYFNLATLSSSGISGLGNKSTAAIVGPSTVNNTVYAYDVRAFSTSWNCDMHINGAMITYTL